MKFELAADQRQLRDTLRDFVKRDIAPFAAQWDKKHEFPAEAIRKAADLGLLGVMAPTEYGGAGLSALDYAIAIEEISRGCASVGVVLSVNNSLVIDPIYKFGTEAQKQQYLPQLASGKMLGCFSLTEPGAGSDAAGQRTSYKDMGDHYLINGAKNFVTNGPQADLCILMATSDINLGNRGVSTFLVETKWPGFHVGKVERKMGICASGTASLAFDQLKVPKTHMLGKEHDGFKIALSSLDGGRIGIAAQALGIAQAALDEAIKYSAERIQFNKAINQFQGIRWMLSDMATWVEAARLMTWKAAIKKDRGERFTFESAQAKLFASETANRVARMAVQIHGGYGYIKEYPVERHMRDARVTEIYEGTSEIQRLVIAANLLKNADLTQNL